MGILVWYNPMCNGLIHCVWWRNKHWVPKKHLKYPNQTQDGQDWPGERHWSDRSYVGANRPSPALLGRHSAHRLRHHPLSTNIPRSRKSSHRAWMIQSPGNGMVPRQCLGKIYYLLEGTSPEQGTQTVVFQRHVPQRLQKVKQDGQRYSVQHQHLEWIHHVEQDNWTEWNEPQLGVPLVLQSPLSELIGGEASRGEDVTERIL